MTGDHIVLKGCRENNLQGIDLQIPKRKLTVFTGVSGSGKSSVVFDTIAQEAGRQLNETFSFLLRMFLPRYSQPDADVVDNVSAAVVIDQSRLGGNARSTVGTATDINTLIRFFFSRIGQPHIGYGNSFSFNDPEGMCPGCEGIGRVEVLDVEKGVDTRLSLNAGAIKIPGYSAGSVQWNMYAQTGFFDLDKPVCEYTGEELHKLLYAAPEKIKAKRMGKEVNLTYEGLAQRFIRLNTTEKERSARSRYESFICSQPCPQCGGRRYNKRALSVKIEGYNIFDLTDMQVDQLHGLLGNINLPKAQPVIDNLLMRLGIMVDIGLGYLSLTRETSTLSGGESQRVKMVKHLTSSLTDMMYIFDEPSIGLHPRDVGRLNSMLARLRDKGNTVIVVEHDPDVISKADYIVDMGPGAGSAGGRVVYTGDYYGLLAADTLTAEYMKQKYPLKANPRKGLGWYECKPSSLHNLKNTGLRVPRAAFTVVTGVAGSGKSTLVNEVFAKEVEAVVVDQSPVTVNSRSNAATYTGIMDTIRKLFANENNVDPGMFSYNSTGACPACKGMGIVELNLSYMDKTVTQCEECNGKRFGRQAMGYLYQGRSIVDVMEMTVQDAEQFFHSVYIKDRLRNMLDVGIGYITLGQPLTTFSGGECQRIKLARELGRQGNLYILDEPTTGLHRSDIKSILAIIDKLVDNSNTVIAIEHNMDIIKHADWVVDMGPEGGSAGGEIIYEGTPDGLLHCGRSITADYVKDSL